MLETVVSALMSGILCHFGTVLCLIELFEIDFAIKFVLSFVLLQQSFSK